MNRVIRKFINNVGVDGKCVSPFGFTLIEVLTVVAIFFLGILGAFTLSLNNLNQVKDNFNRVAAADLAREGIEIIRNIRDTNWLYRDANIDSDSAVPGLQFYDWDTNLDQAAVFRVDYSLDYSTTEITAISGCGSILNACIQRPETQLYVDASSRYAHSGVKPTIFKRAISLTAICFADNGNSSKTDDETIALNPTVSCSSGEKIGYQVTSRVQYDYGGRINNIDVVENIYNWR